jgi:hypothetical protein
LREGKKKEETGKGKKNNPQRNYLINVHLVTPGGQKLLAVS